ncbi:flavin-containing monooxygenase 5-like [Petaurus breviceps papuanus]|uniref:flavin-containing monooxygenase 5-like n=1 Tax=Petaurus breviceps papuanus TaxID=3040969 RepID=UPI0036DB9600
MQVASRKKKRAFKDDSRVNGKEEIGAGINGRGGGEAIKCCLDEGLEPTCFEQSDDIGGLWRFQEKYEEGRPSICRYVMINTSKEMTCFSDSLIPDHFPNYMHNSQFLEYFQMYVKHFDLGRHIHLQLRRHTIKMCTVRKCPDFYSTGQWEVVVEVDGKFQASIFDEVMVCTGCNIDSHLSLQSFPGIEKFKGHSFHRKEYKSPEGFRGKRMIVIGIGNSGADLAVELRKTIKFYILTIPNTDSKRIISTSIVGRDETQLSTSLIRRSQAGFGSIFYHCTPYRYCL